MAQDLEETIPEDFKPVALVIRAQSGEHLKWIEDEVEFIKQKLEGKGFRVVVLPEPNPAEIINVFSGDTRPDYHNRIAIFHFAGHSGEQALSLPEWETTRDSKPLFYFRGLAGFLNRESCLRLVFINGCNSEGFGEYFSAPNATCIFAESPIPDEDAKEFCCKLYDRWAEGKSIEDAFQILKNSVESVEPSDSSTRNMIDGADTTIGFPWKITGSTNCLLANCFSAVFSSKLKETSFEWEPHWPSLRAKIFFLICFAVALASLFVSYLSDYSSPAFQVAYGYAIPESTIEDKMTTDKLHQIIPNNGHPPLTGFVIELVRVGIGTLILYFSFWLLGSPFDVKNISLQTRWLFFIFFVFSVLAVGYYHIKVAPVELAINQGKDNRWLAASATTNGVMGRLLNAFYGYGNNNEPQNASFLSLDEDAWKNAGKKWPDRFADYKALVEGNDRRQNRSEFQSKINGLSFYNQLYRDPYLVYMFYSIVVFVIVAFGLFLVIYVHTLNAINKVFFLLKAVTGTEKIGEYQNEQVRILNKVFDVMRSLISRYSAFLCLLVGGMCYEVTFGFLVLAPIAKTITLIAMALLLCGLILIGCAFVVYNERYQRLSHRPEESKSPFGILKDPVVVVCWCLLSAMFAYLISLEPWKFLL